MPKFWQIGTGYYGRHYFDLFQEYDVMFLGPGVPLCANISETESVGSF